MFKHPRKLKRKKVSGINNLPPGFFKDTAFNIPKPLNHPINLCLSTGKMPKTFKIGKITPRFKNGSKHQFDNYRSITVLPICSKVANVQMLKLINSYLKINLAFVVNEILKQLLQFLSTWTWEN